MTNTEQEQVIKNNEEVGKHSQIIADEIVDLLNRHCKELEGISINVWLQIIISVASLTLSNVVIELVMRSKGDGSMNLNEAIGVAMNGLFDITGNARHLTMKTLHGFAKDHREKEKKNPVLVAPTGEPLNQ